MTFEIEPEEWSRQDLDARHRDDAIIETILIAMQRMPIRERMRFVATMMDSHFFPVQPLESDPEYQFHNALAAAITTEVEDILDSNPKAGSLTSYDGPDAVKPRRPRIVPRGEASTPRT